jgi:hypothetical protein
VKNVSEKNVENEKVKRYSSSDVRSIVRGIFGHFLDHHKVRKTITMWQKNYFPNFLYKYLFENVAVKHPSYHKNIQK